MYNKKYLARCLFVLLAMVIAMYTTKGVGILFLVPLIIGALSGNKTVDLFFYVLVLISMTMGNSILMPKGSLFGIAERSILAVLALVMTSRVVGRKHSPFVTPVLALLPYLLFMALTAFCGWCPYISFLKLFLFTVIFFAYYSVTNETLLAKQIDVGKIRASILSIAIFFLFGSILLIPFPSIGMMRAYDFEMTRNYSSLFMGMTQHSQSLGPIAASIGILVLSDFLFSIRRADKLYIALLICVPVLVWYSHSRTAMGSLIAGCATILWLFSSSRGQSHAWKGKVNTAAFLLAIVLIGLFCLSDKVKVGIKNFALKFNEVDSASQNVSLEEITATRQGLIDAAMVNFHKSPVFGNGFQVSEEMQMYSVTNGGLLVLSAPIEKGVWISAILEEGGVIGMILFLFFALSFIAVLNRRRAYTTISVFVAMLVSNLGEFSMFSMSYTGGMIWALIFVGMIVDATRIREEYFYWRRYIV